jgi:hypothetical protein
MGGYHQTGHLPNEDKNLGSLLPGSRNGKRSLRRPKLSTIKGSPSPGRRRRKHYSNNKSKLLSF